MVVASSYGMFIKFENIGKSRAAAATYVKRPTVCYIFDNVDDPVTRCTIARMTSSGIRISTIRK